MGQAATERQGLTLGKLAPKVGVGFTFFFSRVENGRLTSVST
jgi:hypothetical protein